MKEYDKLSIRLVQILSKFNNGESLSAQELAQEFNVDTRTIQRMSIQEPYKGILTKDLLLCLLKKKMEDMF